MFIDAYLPIPGRGQFSHRFGGRLLVRMPDCPNCHKPFIAFCTLDTTDSRIDLVGVAGELPLIYCMRCAVCWYDFSYQLREGGDARILAVSHGPCDWWDEWYARFSGELPKIGGIPYLIQGVPFPECAICSKRMVFVASLYNDQAKGFEFARKEWAAQIMFFYCGDCRVVTASHST